jgi:Na+-driven multidrug efflux pump
MNTESEQKINTESLEKIDRFTSEVISCKDIIKDMLWIGVPAMATKMCLMLQDVVNMAVIGKLKDKNILAGVGIANAFCAMAGNSVFVGLNGALSTFVS